MNEVPQKSTTAPAPVSSSPGSAVPPTPRRNPWWAIAVAAGLAVLALCVYVPRLYFVETDDAYVEADTVNIVPKVAAYVTALHVNDNSRLQSGQLAVELDPRDFNVAVDSADAELQSAIAQKVTAEQQLAEQTHVIATTDAAIAGDRAATQFAQQELARYAGLANSGAGSAERWQQAQSDAVERNAVLQHDIAAADTARAHIGVLQSQVQTAEALIARKMSALEQARLNLSYTKIYVPLDGTVANKSVQVGDYVQPGQTLFSAVPKEVYVLANFKETQLAHIRPGQSVSMKVDSLPGVILNGHVDSLQRGTGSNFALLPPENATGNFVKVTQRIPVKIILDGPASAIQSISPGMSVEPVVTVSRAPRWLAVLS